MLAMTSEAEREKLRYEVSGSLLCCPALSGFPVVAGTRELGCI